MTAFSKELTGGESEELIAADEHRDHITIQLQDFSSVYLAIGEAAVVGKGIMLIVPGCSVRIFGNKARKAIYGYAEGASKVGIETCEDIEYRPGSFIWFF
jgi:hypothetical protein